jgi:site-specific DNA recombinase
LVQRVSELPPEVPADPFYDQIKQLNQKLTEAKLAKEKIKTKEMDLYGQDIDQDGLKAKIERTLKNLENVPKEYSFRSARTVRVRVLSEVVPSEGLEPPRD